MYRILMVEDEADLADATVKGLQEEGYAVSWVDSGARARLVLDQDWDLILLDLVLPDSSGESLLNFIKQKNTPPSVLILTARERLDDKLTLFRQGCDDYLTKPFVFEELLVRINALLRRTQKSPTNIFKYRDLTLDYSRFRLDAGKDAVMLTPKEASICRLLLSRSEEVVSRNAILEGVWGLGEEPPSDLIGIHVFKLRRKIAQLGRGNWFQTVRATGFMICEPESESRAS